MENKIIKKWALIGFVFISIFGTLSHFMFHFFNENVIMGLFVPINESVWEHLKMSFWPLFFFSIVQYYFIGKKTKNFFPAWAFGILAAEIFVVVFFYGYNLILGKEILILDIMAFFISVALCQFINYKLSIREEFSNNIKILSILLLIIMIIASTVFTFTPPKTGMFYDKNSKSYGIHDSH